MAKILNGLEPAGLWNHFENLCAIPHPSKHEEKIRKHIVAWAKGIGLETIVDEVGNVIIRKPATPGMENRKGIVLQGHIDMVSEKNEDKQHDFVRDPIIPKINGEWVEGTGTTLGADNGIGVAAIMAVLEATDLVHGQVEALFTIDEEKDMTGALGLKSGVLKGDILINLDSEDEGKLYVGCAGRTNANITFNYNEENTPANSEALLVKVRGFKGGHSGIDIVLERGNSNKILNRILWWGNKNVGLRIASIKGGSSRNAIPRESNAVITLPKEKATEFEDYVKEFKIIIDAEYKGVETETVEITADPYPVPVKVIDAKTSFNLVNAIYAMPNGVMRMSQDIKDLVETSTNLACVKSKNGTIEVKCLLRSSVDSAKDDLERMIESVCNLAGAECILDGKYPGWKPNKESQILKVMCEVYNRQFGKTPEITAIHAGLECRVLGRFYKNWDMISFGPTIRFPHSPDEKVNFASVEKFWVFLVDTLKKAPAK